MTALPRSVELPETILFSFKSDTKLIDKESI